MTTRQMLLWLPEETVAAVRTRAATRGGKGAVSAVADEALRAGLGLSTPRPPRPARCLPSRRWCAAW